MHGVEHRVLNILTHLKEYHISLNQWRWPHSNLL